VRPDRQNGTSQPVSIIIPTYNRLKTLRQVFESYSSQDAVGEIVVVDDGSTDGTGDFVAEARRSDPRVHYIRHERRRGQPAARNTGIERSRGAFVLFGEDDLRLGPGYAARLLDCATRHGAAIAAGRILYPLPGESDEEVMRRHAGPVQERLDRRRLHFDASSAADQDLEVPFIHSISLIAREVFETVRFDTGYRGNAYREETDFYLEAGKRGHRIFWCPEAVCIHLPREVVQLGGQMAQGIWAYKFWSLRNNHRFLRRHYADLAQRGLVTDGFWTLSLAFAAAELKKLPSFYLRRYAPGLYVRLARHFQGHRT
jgi:glycosyltransferase involved in cell wall biosynthesis